MLGGRFVDVERSARPPVENGELAAYFGVAPEIMPFVPELLQDLWELGSDPDLIVQWLGEQGLAERARILDLGCGKGAVAIAVAQALGCRVDGVDAMPAFVDIARRQAVKLGVHDLCTFGVGDLRDTVRRARHYNAVLLLSVGVLGSPAEIVGDCRRCVPPGGLMIIDDAYLRQDAAVDFPGYQQLATRDETLRQLTSHGDHVIHEHTVPVEAVRAQNRKYTRWIERRAEQLAVRHPEHADAFVAYVAKERQECEILETAVACVIWMLRRG